MPETSIPRPDRWKILPFVLLAPLMGSLDGSIVNVALPKVASSLGAGLGEVQWVVSSYLIAISALILAFGEAADRIGKTLVFRWGFAVFGLGSLLCALARSLPVLVAARVAQAVGAAMFMSSNQGIIATLFPPGERGKALGFLGTTVSVGTMIGPPLGGAMVEFFGWPSLFLINIPIAAAAFVAGSVMLPREEDRGTLAGFDLAGTALFAAFIAGLFYILLTGRGPDQAGPARAAILAATALAFAAFILRERRAAEPMIDLSIFRSGLFSISVLCVLVVFVALFCVNLVLPFYLQDVLGLAPSAAGLVLLASPLITALIAPLGGALSDRIGAEGLTVAGLALELAALLLMNLLGPSSSPVLAACCLALLGVGSGVFGSPNTKLIMTHAPAGKLGIAGSVNSLARNLGMVSGIALAVGIVGAEADSGGAAAAFVGRMRLVFIAAAGLMAFAIALTAARSASSRRRPLSPRL
jgi:EmrB/QacA subfamily drug resistance transporter